MSAAGFVSPPGPACNPHARTAATPTPPFSGTRHACPSGLKKNQNRPLAFSYAIPRRTWPVRTTGRQRVADFGYGGIGSGLDISGMVSQLVAADRKPADNALNLQQSRAKMQFTAISTVKSAFDTLKTSLTALKAATAFDTRTVSVVKTGTDDILTATASNAAANGSHTIVVESLATANKWIADTSVDKTKTFNAGTLSLTVGTGDAAKVLKVEVAQDDTLSSIRTKIESVARGVGVQATLITSGDQQYLSISQEKTGTANALKLGYDGADADLNALVASMSERTPAADAKLTVDGVAVTSAENKVSTVVPGLTLNLTKTGEAKVNIATDIAASRKVVQDFVTAYNGALAAINTATKYDAENQSPSALTGDAQMRGASSQLRGLMGNVLKDLAAVGLDAKTLGLNTRGYPNADGTLVLDAAKFDAAIASQPDAIRKAFTGDTGAAGKLFAAVEGYVGGSAGKEGAFVARTKSINATLKNIDTRREALNVRMENVAARYKAQFLALDKLMGEMGRVSSSLSQQLSQLAG